MMLVKDLDVLRPEKKIVKIAGKEIDVSFLPCGLTFDVDEIVQEIYRIDRAEVEKGGPAIRDAFMLSIRLCAAFCRFHYPELDEEWFLHNFSPAQVKALAESIQQALIDAYAGIETPQKAAKGSQE